MAALVAALPEAFGDGDVLRFLFNSLFPGTQRPKQLGPNGRPILSDRQVRVLRLAATEQRSQAEIARHLSLSAATVNTLLRNIYRKLGVHNRMPGRIRR